MQDLPLAVYVGKTGLVASIGEMGNKSCVMLKEPTNGHCPLFIFASGMKHLEAIKDAINLQSET